MTKFVGRAFFDQTVRLDGNEFHDCTMRKCLLLYGGGTIPVMEGVRFDDCRWQFDEAAKRTITLLNQVFRLGNPTINSQLLKHVTGLAVETPKLS